MSYIGAHTFGGSGGGGSTGVPCSSFFLLESIENVAECFFQNVTGSKNDGNKIFRHFLVKPKNGATTLSITTFSIMTLKQ